MRLLDYCVLSYVQAQNQYHTQKNVLAYGINQCIKPIITMLCLAFHNGNHIFFLYFPFPLSHKISKPNQIPVTISGTENKTHTTNERKKKEFAIMNMWTNTIATQYKQRIQE